MKLMTIWFSGYPLGERLVRTKDWAWATTAHHMPARLKYWVLIDAGCEHMFTYEVVPEVTFMDIVQRAAPD